MKSLSFQNLPKSNQFTFGSSCAHQISLLTGLFALIFFNFAKVSDIKYLSYCISKAYKKTAVANTLQNIALANACYCFR